MAVILAVQANLTNTINVNHAQLNNTINANQAQLNNTIQGITAQIRNNNNTITQLSTALFQLTINVTKVHLSLDFPPFYFGYLTIF
jgi:hypothetical protein